MQLDLLPTETLQRVDGPEEWRTVAGFPRYEASSLGRFRNRDGRPLKGTIAANGYVHIGLMREGKQEWRLAHRVIAETFLPTHPTDSYLVVHHINGLRNDNRVSNLEWATCQYNSKEWRHRKTTA